MSSTGDQRRGNEACVSHSLRVVVGYGRVELRDLCAHSQWVIGPFLSPPCSATLAIIIIMDARLSYLCLLFTETPIRPPAHLSIVDLPRTHSEMILCLGFIKSRSDSHLDACPFIQNSSYVPPLPSRARPIQRLSVNVIVLINIISPVLPVQQRACDNYIL